jgi:hypothetical protein
LAGGEWTRDARVEHMRAIYEYRKRRLAARAGKIEDDGYEDRSPTSRCFRSCSGRSARRICGCEATGSWRLWSLPEMPLYFRNHGIGE